MASSGHDAKLAAAQIKYHFQLNQASHVVLSEPGGKRPRGRPRLLWEDGMEEDVARLGCRNWKIVALSREGWKKLLKEAETHPGL